jgi:poly(A) polymerase
MTDSVLPSELPNADWRQASGLQKIVDALRADGVAPRIVGGAVRDSLLGLVVSDVDLATPLLPNIVIDRLESAGIKAVPTGLDHGTVTAVADNCTYEITTLRRDVSTDGRRATVAFSTDWIEDAQRRDFTINALYADPESGVLFDYFGGLADLEARHIRFIGDASARIAEDHLRILRYFRFFARFGDGAADAYALSACASAANSLMALSRERIATELIKILSLATPQKAISLMVDQRIFAAFLPELDPNAVARLERLIEREDGISVAARMLSLLPPDANIVDKVATRLKLSNKMRADLIARLADIHPVADKIRNLAYHYGIPCARDIAMLFASDDQLSDCLAKMDGWEPPVFPIKGGDLIKRGLRAGPVVAKTLRAIETAWITADFPMGSALTAITDQLVASALLELKKS